MDADPKRKKRRMTLRRWIYEQNDHLLRQFYHEFDEIYDAEEVVEMLKKAREHMVKHGGWHTESGIILEIDEILEKRK